MWNLISLFNPIYNDAPQPWQIGFQDGASPGYSGIIELHNSIFFYLIIISIGVFWILGSVIYFFNHKNSPIVHKYLNHGTVIETIWTITPALILIAIAFPSFRLLYLLDSLKDLTELNILIFTNLPICTKNKKTLNMNKILRISKKSIININSNCTAIIKFGGFYSSVGIRLNQLCRNITILPPFTREQIIGHLLGDGGIFYAKTSKNPYFTFIQTFKRFKYLWTTFNYLSFLCEAIPDYTESFRNSKNHSALTVRTRSYPFLKDLHKSFYIIENNSFIKIIPENIINELTPRALAFWFMDDGAYAISGVYLHTKGFSFNNVYKLAGVLNYNFKLNVTVQSHENKPVIYIKANSMKNFRNLVIPYLDSSMFYKLNHKNKLK